MAKSIKPCACGVPTAAIIVVAVFAGVVLFSFSRSSMVPQPNASGTPTTSPTPSAEVIAAERRYRESIQSLFAKWNTSSERKDFTALSQQLLAVTVPGRYRSMHLELAVALNYLQRGQVTGDQGKIEEGLSRLDKIFTANPWILEN